MLQENTRKLNSLLRLASSHEMPNDTLEGIHFPLKEVGDVHALEVKLQDPEQEKKVVSYANNVFSTLTRQFYSVSLHSQM